jgi:fructokinase
MVIGGIEAGGTKFICAVGDEHGNVTERIQFPTTTPGETMKQVIDFFKKFTLKAIGVGSFGPIDINPASPTYGYITTSPKKKWRNFPMVRTLQEALSVPVGFHTDVNAAALGESAFGAAKGLDSCLYITVGTGIGAGAVISGKLLQGFSHPEMGHLLLRRHPDDPYTGKCPYHADCFEGLASGPAIEERWGKKGSELTGNPEVWELEAYYIAQALMHYILILAPQKIILGGGVMNQKQLFPSIYAKLEKMLNQYLSFPSPLNRYIVPPGLGEDSGIIGSLLLGKQACGAN